jgi:hypothetical protein
VRPKPPLGPIAPSGPAERPAPAPATPTASGDNEFLALLEHDVIREAFLEAGTGEVRPDHLLAALSRRWAFAVAFYEQLGNAYIGILHQLRLYLGLSGSPPAGSPRARPTVSPEVRRILETARQATSESLDDCALLAMLAEREDSRLQAVLDTLPHGPRTAKELVESAVAWRKAGSAPLPALVAPSGRFPAHFFARLAPGSAPSPEGTSPITRFRLFSLLAAGNAAVASAWQGVGLPAFPLEPTALPEPLYWEHFTEDAHDLLLDALVTGNLGSSTGLLWRLCCDWPLELLANTDPQALRLLTRHGVDGERWERGMRAVFMAAVSQ